ncbi:MAG: cupin domain-containing protein [Acetobacteraceae bacterium]
MATGVEAQGNPGFSRSVLDRTAVEGTAFDTIQVLVAIEPGVAIPRHTHPGTESGTVTAGTMQLSIEGKPDRTLAAGDTFFVPHGVVHSVKNGGGTTKVVSTYVVERDKPLASPA